MALVTASNPPPDLGRRRLIRRLVLAAFATTLLVGLLVAVLVASFSSLPQDRFGLASLLLFSAGLAAVVSLSLFALQTDRLTKHLFAELKRLEDVRRDFVANVSHELKTPLTASRGMVETILDDPEMPDQTQRLFLSKIRDQNERLSALVNDLLALSRIQAEEKSLNFSDVDLQSLCEHSLNSFWSRLRDKNLEVRREFPDRAVVVQGDQESLEVAIGNLLDNAIKYSPDKARLDLTVEVTDQTARITVGDRGIGISAANQERIFERFYRVDTARSHALGGTGLGLSIVKHIALAHGGNVSVDSVEGAGSRFAFTLPLVRKPV